MSFFNLNIKHYIKILVLVFLFWVNEANASLEITEIMYAPESGSSYEWVEIYNNGDSSVNLNKYRFFHGESNSGPITIRSGDSEILEQGGYALILKSMSDYGWANFSCPFFSASTLSLPDSGDNTYIAISDPNKNIIDSLYYDVSLGGGKKEKTSLSKIDGIWSNSVPTPCSLNIPKEVSIDYAEDNNEEKNTSSRAGVVYVNSVKEKEPKILVTTAKIISEKNTIAGLALGFDASVTNNRGITSNIGRFVWNFGDGSSIERDSVGKFEHIFWYPGDYVVTLNYYKKNNNELVSSDRVLVKVIASGLNIYVGDFNDPYVEIENKSNYEINLSNWIIQAVNKNFILPEGTIILPNKKIKISPRITNFIFSDLLNIKILNPNKEVMGVYPKDIVKNIGDIKKINTYNSHLKNNIQDKEDREEEEVFDLNKELQASVVGSKVNINWYILGLVFIIILGLICVIVIRKNKKEDDNIEGGLSSDDFKIIE